MTRFPHVLFCSITLFVLCMQDVHGQEGGQEATWWQETTIYQIYPRSYLDTDGDGIGDLAGIISSLDYISDLGFETIWISPFFLSPQGDFGYDIKNYYRIDPPYGTMDLVDSLIQEVHARDMRIVFDLVLNHTSIEHAWFRESRSSRDNPKSDYYVWADPPKRKKAPNNWINVFNKQAWHYDTVRQQYYYTAFLEFQPDLNWRNPEVEAAMFDMVKYWLEKDVDGFRLDIFNCILEDPEMTDNPFAFKLLPSKDAMKAKFQKKTNNINHPDNIDLAKRLRDTIDRYGDPSRFLIGEALGSIENVRDLAGDEQDNGLNLVFLFDMVYYKFKAKFFRKRFQEFEHLFPHPFTPTIVYGNHDQFRRSRRADNNLKKDKLLTLYQLTARGVPVTYYGEEIGMTNASIPKKQAQDPISKVFKGLPQFMRNWLPVPVNRDVCRTPMVWDESEHGGFTSGNNPWLPVQDDASIRSVAAQSGQAYSLLETYRSLLALRSAHPALHAGSMEMIDPALLPKNVLGYYRQHGEERILVLLNYSKKRKTISMETKSYSDQFQLSPSDKFLDDAIELSPYSGMIFYM